MQENLGWSDENRRRGTCLSQELIAVPRLRSAETRTRPTRRRSRPRMVGRTGQGWRRVDVAHLKTTGLKRAMTVTVMTKNVTASQKIIWL